MDPQSDKVGIKLADDPFFQYIKNNRMVREIMIKPGEHFSPEKIVNLALRQQIGIDNAASVHPKLLLEPEDLRWADMKKYDLAKSLVSI